jgi:hypothetical protein
MFKLLTYEFTLGRSFFFTFISCALLSACNQQNPEQVIAECQLEVELAMAPYQMTEGEKTFATIAFENNCMKSKKFKENWDKKTLSYCLKTQPFLHAAFEPKCWSRK